MTHTQVPGVAAGSAPFLTERDNQRAVDLIETAERSAPYCLCGEHMIAVGHDHSIWLECSSLAKPRSGLSSLLNRITSFTHTRRIIMEDPSA
jgi:hypothetical protein